MAARDGEESGADASASLSLGVLLTVLVALGPLSTDLYLPSLPSMGEALNTDVAMVQLTLSVFIAGYAVAMLIYGPLSDRFGRRPVVAGSLLLYVAASGACVLAPSIETLIAARFVQALGACGGPVIGRAIVRDVHGPDRAARVLSYMGSAMALAPAAAPILGGYLHVALGWRANFAFLALFGIVALLLTWRMLDETNHHRDGQALRPGRLAANYANLLRRRVFMGYALTVAFGFGGLFSWISGSSFALIQTVGMAPQHFGFAFAVVVLGYVLGSLASGRLSTRFGVDRMVTAGGALAVLASLAGAGLSWAGIETAAAVVLPVAVFFSGCGMLLPNGMAGAIGPFPRMAGVASSLVGFLQMSTGAVAGFMVGALHDGTTRPMTTLIAVTSLLSLASFLVLVQPRWRFSRR
ncbi:MAG: multidrug effflux MFS transporter [Alphaproteobacteria bacterium]|nr:multidrug effflux MFS transporter [Alphaproteobacteria bacterium]